MRSHRWTQTISQNVLQQLTITGEARETIRYSEVQSTTKGAG